MLHVNLISVLSLGPDTILVTVVVMGIVFLWFDKAHEDQNDHIFTSYEPD